VSGTVPWNALTSDGPRRTNSVQEALMSAKSARIELRSTPAREVRIRYAAEIARQSLSAFILDAAAERAEEVIASASSTGVPSDFFDRLWAALDAPPTANDRLRRRAAATRRVEQR
jgi:uncharacterized protein (DUF1778 family)